MSPRSGRQPPNALSFSRTCARRPPREHCSRRPRRLRGGDAGGLARVQAAGHDAHAAVDRAVGGDAPAGDQHIAQAPSASGSDKARRSSRLSPVFCVSFLFVCFNSGIVLLRTHLILFWSDAHQCRTHCGRFRPGSCGAPGSPRPSACSRP